MNEAASRDPEIVDASVLETAEESRVQRGPLVHDSRVARDHDAGRDVGSECRPAPLSDSRADVTHFELAYDRKRLANG